MKEWKAPFDESCPLLESLPNAHAQSARARRLLLDREPAVLGPAGLPNRMHAKVSPARQVLDDWSAAGSMWYPRHSEAEVGHLHRHRRQSRFVELFGSALLACACAGPLTHRIVETPAGENVTYGAPRDWSYSVEALPERESLQLRVTKVARCDRIPITLMGRVDETLDGDQIVERKPLSPRQSASPPQGEIECERGFAGRSEVELRIGSDVFQLGRTNARGVLTVDLSERLDRALYDENAPAEATVTIRGPNAVDASSAGSLELVSLAKHEVYVKAMLEELGTILDREAAATPDQVRRSYVLYARLRRLAPNHPDFIGSASRFWELFRERKQRESTRAMTRNLKALKEARELLKDAGLAALPLYMKAAITEGSVSTEATEWAELELLSVVMNSQSFCNERFSWTALPTYGMTSKSMVAARYLHFAFGNPYASTVDGFCKRAR